MEKPQSYTVNYYYKKSGTNARNRTTLTGSVMQHLNGANTENAVLNYLMKKHPGYDVILMNLIWK